MRRGVVRSRAVGYAVVVALLVGPGLAGCSAAPSDGTSSSATTSGDASPAATADSTATVTAYPEAVTDEQVLEVVTAMDAALQSGDASAYLDHVGPELVEQQRDWFEAVRNVPMEVRQLRADKVVSRTSPVGTVLHVGFRHQVTGAGRVPVMEQYRWVLAPDADGEVRLVDVGGRNGQFYGYPQLWDLGPVAVLEADDVVLLAPEEARGDAEELLPQISAAAQALRADFPALAREHDVVHVQLVPTAHVGEVLGGGELMATSWLRTSTEDPGLERAWLGPEEPTLDPRLVLELEAMLEDLDAFGPSPGGNTYARYLGAEAAVLGDDEEHMGVGWVVYGVPTWYELSADPTLEGDLLSLAAEAHREGPPEALPDLHWIPEGEEHYLMTSVSFVRYLEEAFGRAVALDVVEELHDVSGWYDDAEVWPAVTRVVGVSEDDLLEGWQDWGEELLTRADELPPGYTEG